MASSTIAVASSGEGGAQEAAVGAGAAAASGRCNGMPASACMAPSMPCNIRASSACTRTSMPARAAASAALDVNGARSAPAAVMSCDPITPVHSPLGVVAKHGSAPLEPAALEEAGKAADSKDAVCAVSAVQRAPSFRVKAPSQSPGRPAGRPVSSQSPVSRARLGAGSCNMACGTARGRGERGRACGPLPSSSITSAQACVKSAREGAKTTVVCPPENERSSLWGSS